MCAMHNPDVLLCLANLSNDEVFTPPNVANAMLDLLPETLWSDPNATFLDPCCKSGVFLREIAKRLIKGLETKIPDLETRLNHIFKKQLFGIAITELTALLARRSVYCSKYANSKWSVASFDTPEGNIAFPQLKHTWDGNRCRYCGASKEVFESRKESHAYAFIHNVNPEELFKMKFDVIIGNPPYQLSDGGGTGDSAKPIYQHFIQTAMKLKPRFVDMIVPSRWMKGGKGLDGFREEMINDTRISYIYDFENAKECFPGINLDGGVSYFLWNRTYSGKVDYTYKSLDNVVTRSERFLKNNFTNIVIRDYRQISIIEKAQKAENFFSSIVTSRNPFGFNADFFNAPERYSHITIGNIWKEGLCKIVGVKGIKGGARRTFAYIPEEVVKENISLLKQYKLFFSKAYMTTSTVPPEIIIAAPYTLCTETFLSIGAFRTREEAINCLSYISTKFFRALLFYKRHSLNISRESFSFIPMQDFSKAWTDEELYKKYGLTEEEIAFIESMIRPMEVKGDA